MVFHKNTIESLSNQLPFNPKFKDEAKDYCLNWFNEKHNTKNFYFTKSCTQSLEIALLCLQLPFGSEVIMPSYAFVSLANAVNNIGLKCVFIDCEKDTMNIDSNQIEQAITPKTKAIITINYGGVACNYDKIKSICNMYNLYLIEDNAHSILSKYKGKTLGTFGDIATFSFDYMKNISCYQGGGIIINNEKLLNNYYLISEFGTNRRDLLNKKIDFYEWQTKGVNSSLAAPLFLYLKVQLENFETIRNRFNKNWLRYEQLLEPLAQKGFVKFSKTPQYAEKNAHMFWLKLQSKQERDHLKSFLLKKDIVSASHYFPLHLSTYGKKVGEFRGIDNHTSSESGKLLRLPLFFSLREQDIGKIANTIIYYFNKFS